MQGDLAIGSIRSVSRVVSLVLILMPCAGASLGETGPLESEASSGEISMLDLSPLASPGMIDGAFRFTKLRSDGRWAPSAFVRFRDQQRNGKFRIFLYQDTPQGLLVAGYDYVLNGQLAMRKIIVEDIPRQAALRVKLHWDTSGKFWVMFYDGVSHVIETELRSLVPFVAVSSGNAKFSL
jgi:hypothetical protein